MIELWPVTMLWPAQALALATIQLNPSNGESAPPTELEMEKREENEAAVKANEKAESTLYRYKEAEKQFQYWYKGCFRKSGEIKSTLDAGLIHITVTWEGGCHYCSYTPSLVNPVNAKTSGPLLQLFLLELRVVGLDLQTPVHHW